MFFGLVSFKLSVKLECEKPFNEKNKFLIKISFFINATYLNIIESTVDGNSIVTTFEYILFRNDLIIIE